MRRTLWFDRCLDWIFEAYTHATAGDDVRDYLARHPQVDDVLVKMIVQIRTRVAHDVRIDAAVVNVGRCGEYLEVTVRQAPCLSAFVRAIQEIGEEQIVAMAGRPGWIALLADELEVAPPRRRRAPAGRLRPAWAGMN